LHEYQGKALLKEHGVAVPAGAVIRSPEEARQAAVRITPPCVLKVQAWITGRAAQGGVRFAQTPEEAESIAQELLSQRYGNFPVSEVLLEEKTRSICNELFVSFTIDDAAQAPVLLLDVHGGSGIEERAQSVARVPITLSGGVDRGAIQAELSRSPVESSFHEAIVNTIADLFHIMRSTEARALEVNPLAVTTDGDVVALDCRMTIDDYAVFRHPELGIQIARELDHPATELEQLAYRVEENDHRGTFYFAQLPVDSEAGIVGFHGAGGGGSMMSMDAVTNEGFPIANFCDTSGNPSAAKVYRAARIILSQPDLVGYFGSGSGVASQEQFHSAYGLAKAFIEAQLSIPAVVRLGGNSEDRAVEILQDACRDLPGTVEGYRKDDTPAFCAQRFRELVEAGNGRQDPQARCVPGFVGDDGAYSFPITGGRVWIDQASCDPETSKLVIENASELLTNDAQGHPVLAVSEEQVAANDSELIACEIECIRAGRPVVFVDLDLPTAEED
jgi:succinyl-CoA synthetase beta subunit